MDEGSEEGAARVAALHSSNQGVKRGIEGVYDPNALSTKEK